MAYVVRANWRAKEGSEAVVVDAIRKLTPISRQEPGNRFYQAYQDPSEPLVFRLFEIYDDEPSYQAHVASDHFKEFGFGQAIPELEDRERFFYETID
jgi:quinol monooxygenase YgiN